MKVELVENFFNEKVPNMSVLPFYKPEFTITQKNL